MFDKENYSTFVVVPEQPTTYLQEIDTINEFILKRGGSFVSNEEFPSENLMEVLEIFKELIEGDEGEENNLQLTSNAVTPKLVQFFAASILDEDC